MIMQKIQHLKKAAYLCLPLALISSEGQAGLGNSKPRVLEEIVQPLKKVVKDLEERPSLGKIIHRKIVRPLKDLMKDAVEKPSFGEKVYRKLGRPAKDYFNDLL